MPNLANVTKPFLIIGAGRSGSSWLADILAQHPAVQPLTENSLVNTMFLELYKSWWSGDWGWLCDEEERDSRIIRAVRTLFCELFPAGEPFWAMKMIWRGRPWDFVHRLFPDARYIHIVRHPTTAIPSMMEYMGSKNPIWKQMSHTADEYLQGNRDALEISRRGYPYLLIKQEEAQKEPEMVWEQLSGFLGLSPDVPFLEFRRAVNMAASTRSLPAAISRPSLPWSGLPLVVRSICAELGYIPDAKKGKKTTEGKQAAASSPSHVDDSLLVDGLTRQVEEQNQAINELRERYDKLLSDYHKLESGLGTSEDESHAQAVEPKEDRLPEENPAARVVGVDIQDEEGRNQTTFDALQLMHLVITIQADGEVVEPCLGFMVYDTRSGATLFGANTKNEYLELPPLSAGERLEVKFGFSQLLPVGQYGVRVYLLDNPGSLFQQSRYLHNLPEAVTYRVSNLAMKIIRHGFHNPVSVSFSKD
jgi:hypothetical protein